MEMTTPLQQDTDGGHLVTGGPEAISSDQGVRVNASLRQNNETTRRPYHHERHSARREEVTRRSRSGNHTDGTSFQSKGHNEPYQRVELLKDRSGTQELPQRLRSVSKNDREFFRGDSHRAPSLKERYHRREPHREETHTPINRHTSPQEVSSASRNRQPPSERGVPHQMCSSGLAPEAVESALEKIKDTMALYIKCADPSESAARMERLRQAEALGVLEKNAANMVRKANCRAHTSERPPEMDIGMPSSQERTPISARLGPLNAESPPSDRVPVSARLGPLPGEPPARMG
ncbi:hypothetical protein Bca101_062412 [Brassica carinata]